MADSLITYKALVKYDGTEYSGFQKQINGNTIQAELEKALEKICKQPVSILASGRTDAGVHALGQVIQFNSSLDLPEYSWIHAMNTLLPKDIRIAAVEKTDPSFHARFDVKKKRYKYIYTLDQGDPFAQRTKNVIFKKPDISKMQQAAKLLVGTHDFSAFTKELEEGKSPIKTIESVTVQPVDQDIELIFEGDGFLRHQVRRMSEALLMLGLGKLSMEHFEQMIRAERTCPYKAKAQGLYLEKVFYE